MSYPDPEPIPVSWVSKTDLLACRPDLADGITTLTEAQMSILAKELGDALQETYHLALEIVLLRALGLADDAE
jgi:hypothetical protein